jgi:hypothetical protein
MVDIVDMAVDIEAEHLTRGIARAAVPVPAGNPGECEGCDWWMPRLVEGLCAFCRDGRPRPADWEPPTPPTSAAMITPPAAQEEPAMPAKTINLPASADDVIDAIEAHAKEQDLSLGLAAASLIKRGISAGAYKSGPLACVPVDASVPVAIEQFDTQALVSEICRRVNEQERVPDLSLELAEMTARAEAAEAQIADAKLKAQALFA